MRRFGPRTFLGGRARWLALGCIAFMAVSTCVAGPARAETPESGIIDASVWQDDSGTDLAVRVAGDLDPAPARATVTITVALPGLQPISQRVAADASGGFAGRVVLPPGSTGRARIGIEVNDEGAPGRRVFYPRLTWRLDVVDVPAVAAEPVASEPSGDATQFGFISVDGQGRPAQWDACRPVTYFVSTSGMPGGSIADVHQAVARVASATGLTIVFGGETSLPATTASSDLPDSSILIGWTDPTAIPALAGAALGYGGVATIPSGDHLRIRNGWVVLDRTDPVAPGFGPGSMGQVLLHELGHAMNLDHVLEPLQLMFPYLGSASPADYQSGDLAGLGQARAVSCLT